MTAEDKARSYFLELANTTGRAGIYSLLFEFIGGVSFLVDPKGNVEVDGRRLTLKELRDFVAWQREP